MRCPTQNQRWAKYSKYSYSSTILLVLVLVLVLGRSVLVLVLVLGNKILEILDEVYFIKKFLFSTLQGCTKKFSTFLRSIYIHIYKCMTHSCMTVAMSYFPYPLYPFSYLFPSNCRIITKQNSKFYRLMNFFHSLNPEQNSAVIIKFCTKFCITMYGRKIMCFFSFFKF
jgi:hypothetical protein